MNGHEYNGGRLDTWDLTMEFSLSPSGLKDLASFLRHDGAALIDADGRPVSGSSRLDRATVETVAAAAMRDGLLYEVHARAPRAEIDALTRRERRMFVRDFERYCDERGL